MSESFRREELTPENLPLFSKKVNDGIETTQAYEIEPKPAGPDPVVAPESEVSSEVAGAKAAERAKQEIDQRNMDKLLHG